MLGVKSDMDLSIKYFKIGDELEDSGSSFCLGCIYERGYGKIKKNVPLALKYFEKSSSLGNLHAKNSLGKIYEKGIEDHIQIDLNKSVSYYLSGISEPNCLLSLESLLSSSFGVDWDTSLHRYWPMNREFVNSQILCLLIISKNRKKTQNYLVKGIVMNCIKFLCHSEQIIVEN